MENMRLDGVYLTSSESIREEGFFLFPCKRKEVLYQFFLFHKNKETLQIELYRGSVFGDFLFWMQEFASWHPLAKRDSLVPNYTKNYNTIRFSNNDIFFRKEMNHSIEIKDDRILYESDYHKDMKTYHFYPFPPYFVYSK